MTRHFLRASFLLLLVLPAIAPVRAADIVCDDKTCVRLSAFSANIANALTNNAVGYVAIVGGQTTLGGLARTGADTPLPMTSALPISIQSLSKTLTAINALQALLDRNLTIDDYIEPFLPPAWQANPGPNINTITFRQLLTHSSGFRTCNDPTAPPPPSGGFPGDQDYAGLQQMIFAGVILTDKSPFYSNCNFALFRVLIPYLLNNIQDTGDPAADTANAYGKSMQQGVFAPLGITDATCDPSPPPPPNGNMIYWYPNPPKQAVGYNGGETFLSCGAVGWALSAQDLYAILTDLISGNKLLEYNQKILMNLAFLGWDNIVGADCRFPAVCKNGQGNVDYQGVAVPGYWGYIGIYECQIGVVVIANSAING